MFSKFFSWLVSNWCFQFLCWLWLHFSWSILTVHGIVHPEGPEGWLFLIWTGIGKWCPIFGFPHAMLFASNSTLARKYFWFARVAVVSAIWWILCVSAGIIYVLDISWHSAWFQARRQLYRVSHFVFALLGWHWLDCQRLRVGVVVCLVSWVCVLVVCVWLCGVERSFCS